MLWNHCFKQILLPGIIFTAQQLDRINKATPSTKCKKIVLRPTIHMTVDNFDNDRAQSIKIYNVKKLL